MGAHIPVRGIPIRAYDTGKLMTLASYMPRASQEKGCEKGQTPALPFYAGGQFLCSRCLGSGSAEIHGEEEFGVGFGFFGSVDKQFHRFHGVHVG